MGPPPVSSLKSKRNVALQYAQLLMYKYTRKGNDSVSVSCAEGSLEKEQKFTGKLDGYELNMKMKTVLCSGLEFPKYRLPPVCAYG